MYIYSHILNAVAQEAEQVGGSPPSLHATMLG